MHTHKRENIQRKEMGGVLSAGIIGIYIDCASVKLQKT